MIARLQVGVAASVGLAITVLAGCQCASARSTNEAERWRAPAEITDFNSTLPQNCAGCHGAGGRPWRCAIHLTTRSIWPSSRTTQCASDLERPGRDEYARVF